jgi:hypothetical protein
MGIGEEVWSFFLFLVSCLSVQLFQGFKIASKLQLFICLAFQVEGLTKEKKCKHCSHEGTTLAKACLSKCSMVYIET